MANEFEFIVVGGGIVGFATALRILERKPGSKLLVLEKESGPGHHQTGHNSGVIHSGIYYPPGSQKALNCLSGYRQLIEFCQAESIPYEICGKIIVATRPDELPRLEILRQRGQAHGLRGLKEISPEEIREIEPFCRGIRGLYVPQAGIVDYVSVTKKYAEKVQRLGGKVLYGYRVTGLSHKGGAVTVEVGDEIFTARRLVTCGGLHSDRLARKNVPDLDVRITPFRGEYFKLKSGARKLVRNLIYPVPDPAFPFLGVHFTRMIDGEIECGPNAVLAFSREGYRKTDFNPRDTWETISWPGFRKVARKYWRTGLEEFRRSLFKGEFVRSLQRLIPDVRAEDLVPACAGVRAQACGRDGRLLDDFYILGEGAAVHVCNAPSPAATSSLAIGRAIAERLGLG